MAEQWLSIVEYARTYAVSDMTVRRRIKTGRLVAVLKEGKYYIPIGPESKQEAALLEAAESQRSEASPAFVRSSHNFDVEINGLNTRKEQLPAEESSAKKGASYRSLPTQLSSALQRHETTLVDSQALLQFCELSVNKISFVEKHLHESYQIRMEELGNQIRARDKQLHDLRQQVEDLQMLVQLMERQNKK